MTKRLAMIHTGSFHVPGMTELVKTVVPDIEVFNIVDESLLQNTITAGELTPQTARRLAGYVQSAEDAGADVILVTCSSIGAAVDAARPLAAVPVLRIDEAMADAAVAMADRIGVIATLPTTLNPTSDLIRRRAQAQGKTISLVTQLCVGAFDAVLAGDTETHDRLVREGLTALMDQVDVIVLAQASMARVVDTLDDDERRIPILSSPQLGMEAVARVVDEMNQSG